MKKYKNKEERAVEAFDRLILQNRKNGYQEGQFRIVPRDGGHSLQEQLPDISGVPLWREVDWSRNPDGTEAARRRRLLKFQKRKEGQ